MVKVVSGVVVYKSPQGGKGLAEPQGPHKSHRQHVELSGFDRAPQIVLGISALITSVAAVRLEAQNVQADGFDLLIAVPLSGALLEEIVVTWIAHGEEWRGVGAGVA